MTPTDQVTLASIRDYIDERGISPTLQELAEDHGISRVAMFERVHRLERLGLITMEKNKARSIRLVEDKREKALAEAEKRLTDTVHLYQNNLPHPVLADLRTVGAFLALARGAAKGVTA